MSKRILNSNFNWFLIEILLARLFHDCVSSILIGIYMESFLLLSLLFHSVIIYAIKLRLRWVHWFFKWIDFSILRNGDGRNWCSFCNRYWRLSLFLRKLCIISIGESSECIWFCLARLLEWIIDYKLFGRSGLFIIRHHESSLVF